MLYKIILKINKIYLYKFDKIKKLHTTEILSLKAITKQKTSIEMSKHY